MSKPIQSLDNPENVMESKWKEMGSCMLSNNYFLVGGVALGLLGLRRKKLFLFVMSSTTGLMADLAYGYYYNCKTYVEEFNTARVAYETFKVELDKQKERDSKDKDKMARRDIMDKW